MCYLVYILSAHDSQIHNNRVTLVVFKLFAKYLQRQHSQSKTSKKIVVLLFKFISTRHAHKRERKQQIDSRYLHSGLQSLV